MIKNSHIRGQNIKIRFYEIDWNVESEDIDSYPDNSSEEELEEMAENLEIIDVLTAEIG